MAEHHEALLLELVEVFPGGPVAHQVRVGDEHPRRVGMRAEDAHRLPRLDQQGLVVFELLERLDDPVKALPVPRGLAGASIDDQIVGPLGHLGIEVVHQHAHRRLLDPALARADRATGGANESRCTHVFRSFCVTSRAARSP